MFNFSLSVGLRALWYSGQKSTHTLASLGPARLPGSEGSTRPPRGEGPRAGRVMSGSPAPPKAAAADVFIAVETLLPPGPR